MAIMDSIKKLTAVISAVACMSSVAISAFAAVPVLDEETVTECVTTAETTPELSDEEVEISAFILGDVNDDGAVNITDVLMLSSHIKGIKSLDSTAAADINGDGNINVSDVVMLAGSVKGISAIGR